MKHGIMKLLSVGLAACLMVSSSGALAAEIPEEPGTELETELPERPEDPKEADPDPPCQAENEEIPDDKEVLESGEIPEGGEIQKAEYEETGMEEAAFPEETIPEMEETETFETESRTEFMEEATEAPPVNEEETEPEFNAAKETEAEMQSAKTVPEDCIKEEQTESITEAVEMTEADQPKEDDILAGKGSAGYYLWDESWLIRPDFRFKQVAKRPVITEGNLNGVKVYDEKDEAGAVVGLLPYFSIAYVLEDPGDGWLYVESGSVRGFTRKSDLTDLLYASDLVKEIGEEGFATGSLTVEKADNAAYTHTKTTVYDVLAEKEYAIVLNSCSIYEYPSVSARAVGQAASGTLSYILEDAGDGWLYVESDDVRGFVQDASLLSGNLAEDIVEEVGESEIARAAELVSSDENRNLYYTLKSVRMASEGLGEQIAAYALSLVGKTKYIYGGTSLSGGADCSGFTKSVFASAGIWLPRLAQEQGISGEEVKSLSEAEPGDIIYYANGPHVGIYIGSGKVVQCSGTSANTANNPGRGAMVSDVNYMPVTSIRRYLIEGADENKRRDTTTYTQAELELIWAIVAQEDCGSYEGALAVISSAMNRTESAAWSSLGNNALSQLTAPGQYCYSIDRYWVSRLNGNVPVFVRQAVEDCLHKGIRNHRYTCFRSYYTPGSVQIGGGNYYF